MMRPFSACQWKLSASQKMLMAIIWPGVRRRCAVAGATVTMVAPPVPERAERSAWWEYNMPHRGAQRTVAPTQPAMRQSGCAYGWRGYPPEHHAGVAHTGNARQQP